MSRIGGVAMENVGVTAILDSWLVGMPIPKCATFGKSFGLCKSTLNP